MAGHQRHNQKSPEEIARQRSKGQPAPEGRVALPELSAPGLLQRAVTHPRLVTPANVQMLQRASGNWAVTRLLQRSPGRVPIQARLTVNPVGDQYEQEADRVAAQVVGQIRAPQAQAVQPFGKLGTQRQEEEELQMQPTEGLQRLPGVTQLLQRSLMTDQEWKRRTEKTWFGLGLTKVKRSAELNDIETKLATYHEFPNPYWLRNLSNAIEVWQTKKNKKLFGIGSKRQTEVDDLRQQVNKESKRWTMPPEKPTVRDVKQAAIGDCFLLAALISIVNKKHDHIRGLLKEAGEDEAEITLWSDGLLTLDQVSVRVDKNDVKLDHLTDAGEPWVKLIELAYGQKFGSIKGGGDPRVALNRLTGKWGTETEEELVLPEAEDVEGILAEVLFTYLERLPSGFNTSDVMTRIGSGAKTRAEGDGGEYQGYQVRAEDTIAAVEQELEDSIDDEQLRSEILEALRPKIYKQFPGKRGTGKYTTKQEDLYKKLKEELEQDHPVVASTRGEITREDKKHHKGIYRTHAHAVVKVEESKHEEKEGGASLKWVWVVNPHRGGEHRAYEEKEGNVLGAVKKDQSQRKPFRLELSDFTKRMALISYGTYGQSEEQDIEE